MRRLALPLLVAAACHGCGGDGGTGPPPPGDPPLLNTPDELVDALADAWNARDHTRIAPLLHDQFVFEISPNDVEFWGFPESWDLTVELDCARTLFGGGTGLRPGGYAQPAVDLRFDFGAFLTAPPEDWGPSPDQTLPGYLYRQYEVFMFIQYTNGDFDFVEGRQEFFLEEIMTTQSDGSPARKWVIRHWRDRGQPLASLRHGVRSWGYLKALYQTSGP